MNLELHKAKAAEIIINPMIEFLEEFEDEDYTREDIQRCEDLIHAYLNALACMDRPTKEEIMEQVKTLVLALNELNEATDYTLIETDAREAICEVIHDSAVDCGLQGAPYDLTEEWREW